MNNINEGWKKVPLHIAFGFPFGMLAWYGGWSGAATFVAWRVWEEYLDWSQKRDTLGKALVDLASQVFFPVVLTLLKVL